MISRGYAWLNEDVEHSDEDAERAAALARRWSHLKSVEEDQRFRRQADREDGYYTGPEACEDCAACRAEDYNQCEFLLRCAAAEKARWADQDLEIELVEDKLAAVGARIARPYEHWNEDEAYMQYMEEGRFGNCSS